MKIFIHLLSISLIVISSSMYAQVLPSVQKPVQVKEESKISVETDDFTGEVTKSTASKKILIKSYLIACSNSVAGKVDRLEIYFYKINNDFYCRIQFSFLNDCQLCIDKGNALLLKLSDGTIIKGTANSRNCTKYFKPDATEWYSVNNNPRDEGYSTFGQIFYFSNFNFSKLKSFNILKVRLELDTMPVDGEFDKGVSDYFKNCFMQM